MESKDILLENRMILLGAAGRNLGKTELAVRLIGHYAKSADVVGVKVVTVKNRDNACPRGGHGCGICSGLKGFYDIREEQAGGAKDTQRFLTAGAKKSYLVRATPDGLLEALRDLLSRIAEKTVIICESNSARTVLKPGYFVMLQSSGRTRKPSAELVWNLADRIAEATEEDFQDILCNAAVRESSWRDSCYLNC